MVVRTRRPSRHAAAVEVSSFIMANGGAVINLGGDDALVSDNVHNKLLVDHR